MLEMVARAGVELAGGFVVFEDVEKNFGLAPLGRGLSAGFEQLAGDALAAAARTNGEVGDIRGSGAVVEPEAG